MFGVVAIIIIYSVHFSASNRLGSLESRINDKADALTKLIDKLKEGCPDLPTLPASLEELITKRHKFN
ncbi:unnamed protein product [Meloidogyne enterolobii]|uniref:Uncharacterized protein n=1 Tax=Meloidogyne enterolobii TaxID=390850 RepID=A0ACB0YIA3_MELEN